MIIGDRLIKAFKICGHSLLEDLPRRIDRLQRRKLLREETVVENRKRVSAAEYRLREVAIQSFAEGQRPFCAGNERPVFLVRQIIDDAYLHFGMRTGNLLQDSLL